MPPTRLRALLALPLIPLGLLGCAGLSAPVGTDPWSEIQAGTHALGASTGWAEYEAKVLLDDQSGNPDLGSGAATADLDPIGGGALKYNYFVEDDFSVGLIVEARSFDPQPTAPLSATLDGDEYTSLHYLLTTRWWAEPFGPGRRWRWFGGLDLAYTPTIELDATVIYAPGFIERISLSGDPYVSINPVIGTSYLLARRLSLELGAFYEIPLGTSDDDVTLNVPNGLGQTEANDLAAQVDPKGLILFLGLTYYL
jgi:hypothetical protein